MKYILIIFFLIISSIGIFLYNKEDGKIKETNQPFKIVAFGDSLTAGYGVGSNESYPSLLEAELKKENPNIKVVNLGVSGETTTGGLERVDLVISEKPQLVLLGLGANDMLRSVDTTIVQSNLEKMIQKFQAENIQVILLGMESQINNPREYRAKFDQIYKDLADKYDLALVPFLLDGVVLVKSLNISDGIHPNKAGYEKIVKDNILPVVRKVFR